MCTSRTHPVSGTSERDADTKKKVGFRKEKPIRHGGLTPAPGAEVLPIPVSGLLQNRAKNLSHCEDRRRLVGVIC